MGNLLLMDYQEKPVAKDQIKILETVARRIVHLLEFDFSLDIVKEQFQQAKDTGIKLRSFFESTGSCHVLIGKELEVMIFNNNMAEFLERITTLTSTPELPSTRFCAKPTSKILLGL